MMRTNRAILPLVTLAALAAVWVGDLGAQAQPRLSPRDMAMKIPGTFTLASVGDLIIRRPASEYADEGLQAAITLIRDADLAVGNLEGSGTRHPRVHLRTRQTHRDSAH
jgi:hypothetical protein